MGKFDYPELIKNGTIIGPVTVEMRARCKQMIREHNKSYNRPLNDGIEYWPDMLEWVRKEIKKMGENKWRRKYITKEDKNNV